MLIPQSKHHSRQGCGVGAPFLIFPRKGWFLLLMSNHFFPIEFPPHFVYRYRYSEKWEQTPIFLVMMGVSHKLTFYKVLKVTRSFVKLDPDGEKNSKLSAKIFVPLLSQFLFLFISKHYKQLKTRFNRLVILPKNVVIPGA